MTAVANIDQSGVDRRLARAVWAFAATLVLLVAMTRLGAPGWSYSLLFVPFFGAVNLAFQGLYKT